MPRFSLPSPKSVVLVPGVALTLIVAGCDRQSEPTPQPSRQTGSTSASVGGKTLTGTLDRSHRGERLPDFTFADPANGKLALPSLAGKPALVNLWATWCAPCVTEMPMLDSLADDYAGKLRVVTISQDMKGADLVKPFFAQQKFARLEPWLDPENDLGFHYGGGAVLPTTILYGAEGREIWRMIGGYDWSTPTARALVDEALPASRS